MPVTFPDTPFLCHHSRMVMSGELGVIQVAGLLQLLDRRGRDAVCVHVRTPEDRVGEIFDANLFRGQGEFS